MSDKKSTGKKSEIAAKITRIAFTAIGVLIGLMAIAFLIGAGVDLWQQFIAPALGNS